MYPTDARKPSQALRPNSKDVFVKFYVHFPIPIFIHLIYQIASFLRSVFHTFASNPHTLWHPFAVDGPARQMITPATVSGPLASPGCTLGPAAP